MRSVRIRLMAVLIVLLHVAAPGLHALLADRERGRGEVLRTCCRACCVAVAGRDGAAPPGGVLARQDAEFVDCAVDGLLLAQRHYRPGLDGVLLRAARAAGRVATAAAPCPPAPVPPVATARGPPVAR